MKNPRFVLYLILLLLMGIALTTPPHHQTPGFFADEAVYFSMTLSLARDFDLEWTRHDLENVCEIYPAGPTGVILRKNIDGTVVYAKPLLYPLTASILFLFFGPQGIVLLNMLALWFIIRWLAIHWNFSLKSVIFSAATLLLSAFAPYSLWYHPELFTAFLVAGFSFHCLKWLQTRSTASCIMMSIFLAAAATIKPPLVIIGCPAVFQLVKQKQWKPPIIFLVLVISIGLLTVLFTGSINPYEGNRKIFQTAFPGDNPHATFETGDSWSTSDAGFHFDSNVFGFNLFYFLFGRFTGLFWYFFPGVIAAILAVFAKNNHYGRQLLCIGILLCLAQLIMIPTNYHGGGGALGNRYFVNFYPLFLFALPAVPGKKSIMIIISLSAILCGAFSIRPWMASYEPGKIVMQGLYKQLPAEWTLTGAFPIFHPDFYHVKLQGCPGHFYFLNTSTRKVDTNGFMISENGTGEFFLELPVNAPSIDLYGISSQGIVQGEFITDQGKTPFLTGDKKYTPLTLPLGTNHHKTDIYGVSRWISHVKCRLITPVDTPSAPDKAGSVIFRTAPERTQQATSVKKTTKKHLKMKLQSYNKQGD